MAYVAIVTKVRSLAQEPTHAMGAAKKKKIINFLRHLFLSPLFCLHAVLSVMQYFLHKCSHPGCIFKVGGSPSPTPIGLETLRTILGRTGLYPDPGISKVQPGVPVAPQQVKILTGILEDSGLIPGLAQWV